MSKDIDRAQRRSERESASITKAAGRLVMERVAQGLPAKVTDPVVLARIAAILRSTDVPTSEEPKLNSRRHRQPIVDEQKTPPVGDSSEQREAEAMMIQAVGLARGVSLKSCRLDLGEGASVQVDGVAPDHSLFCEAFAHQGPLKGGQPHKVLSDAFKLAFLARRWPRAELLLVFSDDEAARQFLTARSWMARALKAFGVTVQVVKLSDPVRHRLRMAQVRQKR